MVGAGMATVAGMVAGPPHSRSAARPARRCRAGRLEQAKQVELPSVLGDDGDASSLWVSIRA